MSKAQVLKRLLEGVWAFPSTIKKVEELEKLMSFPIRGGKKSEDALYGVLGDDTLFDQLSDFPDSDDVRDLVAKRLQEIIKSSASFNPPLEKGVKQRLLKLAKKHR
jgi:hypothetical protein|tara:strand:+ start:521 stop:838 length:318 start_codon:yes stop_codon:yes gene_type:complete